MWKEYKINPKILKKSIKKKIGKKVNSKQQEVVPYKLISEM